MVRHQIPVNDVGNYHSISPRIHELECAFDATDECDGDTSAMDMETVRTENKNTEANEAEGQRGQGTRRKDTEDRERE